MKAYVLNMTQLFKICYTCPCFEIYTEIFEGFCSGLHQVGSEFRVQQLFCGGPKALRCRIGIEGPLRRFDKGADQKAQEFCSVPGPMEILVGHGVRAELPFGHISMGK